jgi:two-component system alkaline phosphatase synthesis response regulator PhoP
MSRILIVEDEPAIAFALETDLQREGYDVVIAPRGDEGLRLAREGAFDLVLLDIMLPGMDGFDVCRELRRAGVKTPVIVLTARAHDAEKVLGLELGADDYITKPFNPMELRARIKAVLRRTTPAGTNEGPDVFKFANIEVDFTRAEVRRDSAPVALSALEFKLLTTFVRSKGRLLTRDQLLDSAWGPDISLNDRVVDNHIVGLRRKLEADPAAPKHFLNIRGLGYRFDA